MIANKSKSGFTALHFAADGHRDEQCIDVMTLLLSKGVSINEVTHDGYTILHRAINSLTLNKIDFISFLLDNSVDVNGCTTVDISSHTTLQPDYTLASVKPRAASENVIDTPLHLAIDTKDLDIICLLLNKGANIETKDSMGRTALLRCVLDHEATLSRLKIAHELLNRGADVGVTDNLGKKVDTSVWCNVESWV